jgi:hypothetical protein
MGGSVGGRKNVVGRSLLLMGTFRRMARGPRWQGPLIVAFCLALLCSVSGPPATALAAAHHAARSCGVGVAPGPAPTRTGNAHLALNIARGVAGSKIVARGSGWPSGTQVQVDVEQDSHLMLTPMLPVPQAVAADGSFEAPAIAAPGQVCAFQPEPGTVVQVIARSLDGRTLAKASFTYIAEPPVLAPAAGTTIAGTATALSVTGLGWGVGTLVTLWAPIGPTQVSPQNPWLPPAGIPVDRVHADARGAFAASVPLAITGGPLRPGTSISLVASASTALYGDVAVVLPAPFMVGLSIMPVLALDHAQGLAGAALTVTGDHWWPSDTVQIAYCRGTTGRCDPNLMQQLGTATVDGNGHFSVQVALPSNAHGGPISVEAYVGDGMVSPYIFTQPFEVVPPPLPWNKVHPRLARYLPILAVALLLLIAAGAVLWRPALRRWRAMASNAG